jgi:tetratricopeptide (TPR) repeat protein
MNSISNNHNQRNGRTPPRDTRDVHSSRSHARSSPSPNSPPSSSHKTKLADITTDTIVDTDSDSELSTEFTQTAHQPPPSSPLRRLHQSMHVQPQSPNAHTKHDSDPALDDEEEEEEAMNHAISEMESALQIQKRKYGNQHATISHTLHALAIEYKLVKRFDTAIMYMKDAIDVVDGRLDSLLHEEMQMQRESEMRMEYVDGMDIPTGLDTIHSKKQKSQKHPASSGSSQSSAFADSKSKYEAILSSSASRATQRKTIHILTEKSVLYSTLANIYKSRSMFREAMDYYLLAVNMLIEAGYSGDSRRVKMLVRIMKRVEALRRSSGLIGSGGGENENENEEGYEDH